MDEAIRTAHQTQIQPPDRERTAEIIKTTHGTAYPSDTVETIEVKGRDLVSGFPKSWAIDSEEVGSPLRSN
jgi:rod shape-determining protein MreB